MMKEKEDTRKYQAASFEDKAVPLPGTVNTIVQVKTNR